MLNHNESQGRAPKFALGQTVITPGAMVALAFNNITPHMLLHRHSHGDWGDISADDKALNDQAIKDGGRILSAYTLADEQMVWIITESDRSASTILLPSEY